MSSRRRLLLPFVFVGPAACGQLLAEQGSGSDPPAVMGDGSTSDVDGGSPSGADGSSDGSVADAPSVPDADACAVKFCSPFDDEAGVVPFNWDRVGPSASALANILDTRTDTFTSGPRALRVVTTPSSALEQWLELAIGAAAAGSVDLAIRVDAVAGPGASLKLLALHCDTGGDAAQVWLEADRKLTLMSGDGAFIWQTAAIASGTWSALRLEFVKSADVTAVVSSKLTFAGATTQPVTFTGCVSPLKVRLGAALTDQRSSDVSFDDVAIDWQ